jgi:hypothetical protein
MNQIAFLVLSCDKYSDLWKPYSCLFNKYWSDCPFDKYFATNKRKLDQYGFKPILLGDDITWSNGLYNALSNMGKSYQYILIALEDLFIMQNVNTEYLLETIEQFITLKGNYLRLYTTRKPHIKLNQYFGVLDKNTPYRQNCVYSLWKIDTLKAIINKKENAWEFEKKGVLRSYNYDGFYSANLNHFVISNTVVKGKWVKSELDKIRIIIPEIVISRPIMRTSEEISYTLKKWCFNMFFKYVPYRWQNRIYNSLNNKYSQF